MTFTATTVCSSAAHEYPCFCQLSSFLDLYTEALSFPSFLLGFPFASSFYMVTEVERGHHFHSFLAHYLNPVCILRVPLGDCGSLVLDVTFVSFLMSLLWYLGSCTVCTLTRYISIASGVLRFSIRVHFHLACLSIGLCTELRWAIDSCD